METIISELKKIKQQNNVEKAYIFGSFIIDNQNFHDIDVIFFYNNRENRFSLGINLPLSYPIKRIQYNGYKRSDSLIKESSNKSYDIVVINDRSILDKFIDLNYNRIVEF